jgi:eukaryotic-like serine/threonine-protein kinase
MKRLIRMTASLVLLLSIASCGGPPPTLRATVVPMVVGAPVLSRPLEPDGMVQVYVPAGEFLMGWDGTGVQPDELPQHRVYLDAYWIDRTEVTNAMFGRFVAATAYATSAEKWDEGSDPAHEPSPRGANWRHPTGPDSDLAGLDDHPVVQVSWEDATAYCGWAGRRLPTEAEWEKAARGSDGRIFPWGNALPTGSQVNGADRRMRISPPDRFIGGDGRIDDGYARTAPVGSYPDGASPYGALDMAGNVSEWVYDWWDVAYYTHSPARNPTGPATAVINQLSVGPGASARDNRGGDFLHSGYELRTTLRWPYFAYESYTLGFRCARSP